MTLLDFVYWIVDQAIAGIGPFESASELADEHRRKFSDPELAIDDLIQSELLKIGTSGFLMRLPGMFALPLTLPANLGADYLLSARVAAAIASLRGWNLEDPSVRTFVVVCLIGSKGKDVIKEAAVVSGSQVVRSLVGRFARRAVPVVGGAIGSGLDCSYLYFVAKAAREYFTQQGEPSAKHHSPQPGRRGYRSRSRRHERHQ